MREKPGFPAHPRVSWKALAEHRNGWLGREGIEPPNGGIKISLII